MFKSKHKLDFSFVSMDQRYSKRAVVVRVILLYTIVIQGQGDAKLRGERDH